MNDPELLTIDREVAELSATIERARQAEPEDPQGCRPLIPAGQETNAIRLSGLRRQAERLRTRANVNSQSAAPSSPVAPAPAPAASAACKPKAAGPGPLTAAQAEAVAAALAESRERAVALLAEAEALGIAREHVSAAVASNMTAEHFIARYAPGEALARQIARSAELAGL